MIRSEHSCEKQWKVNFIIKNNYYGSKICLIWKPEPQKRRKEATSTRQDRPEGDCAYSGNCRTNLPMNQKLNPLWCRAKNEMMRYSVNWLRYGCLILRANPSQWNISKVLALAQTILTIQLTLPQNKQTISRTMLMKRHQRIAPLFKEEFWGTQWRSQDIDPLRGILSIFVSRKQSDYAKRREILIRLP